MDEYEYLLEREIIRTEEKKRYVLVIYDIIDNKKRLQFSKVLEGYGIRVQKSAFEAMMTDCLYHQLLAIIPKYIDVEDSIRVYKIRGEREVAIFGNPGTPLSEDVIII